MRNKAIFSWRLGGAAAVALVLAGCVTVPNGPSQMSLPGTGKSFDQFRFDDGDCRQYASSQVGGGTPDQAGADSGVKSAAIGTLVGAAAGAAIGGSSGAAGVGAGVGLLGGALAGSGAANASSYALQQRYDAGYTQCMYAKGHKVPVSGRFTSSYERPAARRYAAPPPPNQPPPPGG
jgi:hypothetical protein